jgi:phycobilisome rod-core linker protein
MSLPLLEYKPTSQNQRVPDFGVVDLNEEASYIYQFGESQSPGDVEALIWAAYRQVFNEQEVLSFNRQTVLETRLKNHSITVRDFIRGLAKSERFYRLVIEPNNNYRLVELALKRLLGRAPYSKEEEITLSIQIATQGWNQFVDMLLDGEEYSEAFGDNIVPYQRKRMAERPFSFTPRYGAYYRDQLPLAKPYTPANQFNLDFDRPFDLQTFLKSTNWGRVSGLLIVLTLGCLFLLALSAFSNPIG